MRALAALCISIAVLSGCDSSNDDGVIIADTPPNMETSQQDRTFIRQATIGGLYEIQSAQWALDQDLDAKVGDLVRMILEDHKAANAELKSFAVERGIQIPDSLDAKHQALLRDLKQSSKGRADDMFIEQQINAHRDAIALYQEEAQSATDIELRAFARKQLPVLREHLDALQKLD